MPLSSRLGFSLALGLVAALSAPGIVSATAHKYRENPISHSLTVKTAGHWQTTPNKTIAAAAYSVKLNENGRRLAAQTDDGTSFEVWNTQTNALLLKATADEPDSSFSAVAISKDGTEVAAIKYISTGGEQLIVQSVKDGRVLLNQPLNEPQSPPKKDDVAPSSSPYLVFSPDGKQVITQSGKSENPSSEPFASKTTYNHLNFHDIKTGAVTQSIDLLGVDDNDSKGYMVSPDGNLLASLSSNFSNPTISDLRIITRVTIWQRNKDGRFDYLTTLPIAEDGIAVFNAAFTAHNQLNLITTSSLSNLLANPMAEERPQTRLETWNPKTAKQVSSTVLPAEPCVRPYATVLSPDGMGYYSSYPDDGTCLGDIKTGAFQKLPDQPFAYNIVGFSGNGNHLAISNIANSNGPNVQIFSKSKK